MALAAALLAAMLQTMPAGLMTLEQSTMKTLEQGVHSNIDDARQVVVRTDGEWDKLWQEHGAGRPRPAVNFAREMVVGVFIGSRPTAGFRVEILSAEPHDGKLVVRYQEITPGRGAMTAQVITTAYHLVALPTSPGQVTFEKVEK